MNNQKIRYHHFLSQSMNGLMVYFVVSFLMVFFARSIDQAPMRTLSFDLGIHIDRAMPTFIALKESQLSNKELIRKDTKEFLDSVHNKDIFIDQICVECVLNLESEKNKLSQKEVKPRLRSLAGVTIRGQRRLPELKITAPRQLGQLNISCLPKKMANKKVDSAVQVSALDLAMLPMNEFEIKKKVQNKEKFDEVVLIEDWVESLKPELQNRVVAAQNRGVDFTAIDLATVDINSKVHEIISQEKASGLLGSVDSPKPRHITSSIKDSKGVLVYNKDSHNEDVNNKENHGTEPLLKSPETGSVSVADNNLKSFEDMKTRESDVTPFSHKIRGSLALSPGLAMTDKETLVVYQKVKNDRLAQAQINWETGQFVIEVKEPVGRIVAMMFQKGDEGKDEDLVAYSEQRIGDPNEPVNLFLQPLSSTDLFGTVMGDLQLGGGEWTLSGVKIQIGHKTFESEQDGAFEIINFPANGHVIASLFHHDFWPAVASFKRGYPNSISLIETPRLHHFFDQVKENIGMEVSSSAVIWGRVLDGATPLSGAKVQVRGHEPYFSYYFNSIEVEPKRESTNTDGRFAIVGLETGIYIVDVEWRGQVLPSQFIWVNKHQVSFLEIQAQAKEYQVSVVDVFDKNPVNQNIYDPLEDYSIKDPKQEKIFRSKQEFFNFIDVGQDQEMIRYYFKPSAFHIEVSYVLPEWIDQIKREAKISDQIHSGVVVVLFPSEMLDNNMKLNVLVNDQEINDKIYFTRNGEWSLVQPNSDDIRGVIIYNVSEGINHVEIQGDTSLLCFKSIFVGQEAPSVFQAF